MPGSPFAGVELYVDPDSPAARQAEAWRTDRPADATSIAKIAAQPQAAWLGGWLGDVRAEVAARVRRATSRNQMALFVAYNIPGRDCGSHSAGGAPSSGAYREWIGAVDEGLGDGPAAIVLEPDALAQLCEATGDHVERLGLLSDAVTVLSKAGRRAVYLDAGHAGWQRPDVMASWLRSAGIAGARGFSLNVSNFGTVEEETAYGEAVSALLGGKPFVIDTSRSGLGRTTLDDWCNPLGRALGRPPGADTGHPLVDAFLWIKNPGESDGGCDKGDPPAGQWWPEQALGLAQRASW